MGMNMVNLAVDRICRHVVAAIPCEHVYLRCNYSSDKKPAAINRFRPYGKEVAIDLTLPGDVVRSHLGVSPRELVDLGQVVNASIGFLDLELVGDDDVYVAARLPNLVVATVGGGTALPTQRECLELLGCVGDGTTRKFAEIVGAALVAGELAICAALADGRFIEAHRRNRVQG